jgi:hypothetical protein
MVTVVLLLFFVNLQWLNSARIGSFCCAMRRQLVALSAAVGHEPYLQEARYVLE